MLINIQLHNFALIEYLDINFGEKLNVLTGETGAGKSIIVDAISLCLGARASSSYIRSGAESTRITLSFFHPESESLNDILEEAGIERDDLLILEREVFQNNRSICRINGKTVTLKLLSTLGRGMISIHGQHELTELLDNSYQLQLIDDWGGSETEDQLKIIREIITDIRTARRSLEEIGEDEQQNLREQDILEYQIKEINDAALKVDELNELEKESNFLHNHEKIITILSNLETAVFSDYEQQQSLLDKIGDGRREISGIVSYDNNLEPISGLLNSIYYDIEELQNLLVDYQENFEFDPKRLEFIENRINFIHSLRRKYGREIVDILNFKKEAEQRLDILRTSKERRQSLKNRISELEKLYKKSAADLSAIRTKVAEGFCKAVEEGIRQLGMQYAQLESRITFREDIISLTGSDDFELYFSANKGEPTGKLADNISGGELARMVLVIKSLVAEKHPYMPVIFDEIDTGIGGLVANGIASRLRNLASNRQVFCVSHLPVIAAYAHHHYAVIKIAEERTVTKVQEVKGEERVTEIMRMLGSFDDISQQQALKLLQQSQKEGDPR